MADETPLREEPSKLLELLPTTGPVCVEETATSRHNDLAMIREKPSNLQSGLPTIDEPSLPAQCFPRPRRAPSPTTDLAYVEETWTSRNNNVAGEYEYGYSGQYQSEPQFANPSSPRRLRITGYRLIVTFLTISLGTWKAISSARGSSAANALDWVVGVVIALLLFWIERFADDVPDSGLARRLFHTDYSPILSRIVRSDLTPLIVVTSISLLVTSLTPFHTLASEILLVTYPILPPEYARVRPIICTSNFLIGLVVAFLDCTRILTEEKLSWLWTNVWMRTGMVTLLIFQLVLIAHCKR